MLSRPLTLEEGKEGFEFVFGVPMRDCQAEFFPALMQALWTRTALVAQAPTGFGKTNMYLFACYLSSFLPSYDGGSVVVTGDTKALQKQYIRIAQRFRAHLGSSLALYGRGNYPCGLRLQAATNGAVRMFHQQIPDDEALRHRVVEYFQQLWSIFSHRTGIDAEVWHQSIMEQWMEHASDVLHMDSLVASQCWDCVKASKCKCYSKALRKYRKLPLALSHTRCPYARVKMLQKLHAKITFVNTSFAQSMAAVRPTVWGDFVDRRLVLFDEAHTLPDKASSIYASKAPAVFSFANMKRVQERWIKYNAPILDFLSAPPCDTLQWPSQRYPAEILPFSPAHGRKDTKEHNWRQAFQEYVFHMKAIHSETSFQSVRRYLLPLVGYLRTTMYKLRRHQRTWRSFQGIEGVMTRDDLERDLKGSLDDLFPVSEEGGPEETDSDDEAGLFEELETTSDSEADEEEHSMSLSDKALTFVEVRMTKHLDTGDGNVDTDPHAKAILATIRMLAPRATLTDYWCEFQRLHRQSTGMHLLTKTTSIDTWKAESGHPTVAPIVSNTQVVYELDLDARAAALAECFGFHKAQFDIALLRTNSSGVPLPDAFRPIAISATIVDAHRHDRPFGLFERLMGTTFDQSCAFPSPFPVASRAFVFATGGARYPAGSYNNDHEMNRWKRERLVWIQDAIRRNTRRTLTLIIGPNKSDLVDTRNELRRHFPDHRHVEVDTQECRQLLGSEGMHGVVYGSERLATGVDYPGRVGLVVVLKSMRRAYTAAEQYGKKHNDQNEEITAVYNWKSMLLFVQACGRAVRCESDSAILLFFPPDNKSAGEECAAEYFYGQTPVHTLDEAVAMIHGAP